MRPFLLVGQTVDLDPELAAGRTGDDLRRVAAEHGTRRGPAAIDYFVFTPGLFDPMPPFVVGRAGFDNWLIWRARRSGGPVVDATEAVAAVHLRHGYGHLAGGKPDAYYGPEAQRNVELAGGRSRIYTLHDASHRLRGDLTLARNLGATLRARETLRKVGWKLGVR
jgi:hypothetical protein